MHSKTRPITEFRCRVCWQPKSPLGRHCRRCGNRDTAGVLKTVAGVLFLAAFGTAGLLPVVAAF